MTDWVLRAIQEKAMKEAREELSRVSSTWQFMGFDEHQLSMIVINARNRFNIDPSMSVDEIRYRLK